MKKEIEKYFVEQCKKHSISTTVHPNLKSKEEVDRYIKIMDTSFEYYFKEFN